MTAKNIYEKYGVYVSVIALISGIILSSFALIQTNILQQKNIELIEQANIQTQQANNLTQLSFQLQNTTSNFMPKVFVYSAGAFFEPTPYHNETGLSEVANGQLNINLIVISPHASVVNLTSLDYTIIDESNYTNINGVLTPIDHKNEPVLDPNKFGLNHLSFEITNPPTSHLGYYEGNFVDYVESGVSRVNFSIPVCANFHLNPKLVNETFYRTPQGYFPFLFCNYHVVVTLYDIQLEKNIAERDITGGVMIEANIEFG